MNKGTDRKIVTKFACFVFGLTIISVNISASDIYLTYGAHDLIVGSENSHTFGVDIGIIGEGITDTGVLLNGSFTMLLDYDEDKLDPDHEPVWFKTNAQAKKEIYQLTPTIRFDWLARFDGNSNTVSAVEDQVKLFTGIGAVYKISDINLGLKVLAGYYFLEIDDDVPRIYGYDRSDLQNNTGAYTLMADSEIRLNPNIKVYARIQRWNNSVEWLENQYELLLSYDSNEWIKGSTLSIDAEHIQYNLDPYQKHGFAPIIPWNNHTLVRAYITLPWK